SEDVELGRIEDQAAARRGAHRLPVFVDLVVADAVDVDQAGVAARLVADDPARAASLQVDADRHAVDDLDGARIAGLGLGRLHQAVLLLQAAHEAVARDRPAAANAQLAQARALAH